MVLSCDGVSLLFSNLSFSQILKFAEDISVLLSDDKQKPNGALIRKHLCIPCRGAFELKYKGRLAAPGYISGRQTNQFVQWWDLGTVPPARHLSPDLIRLFALISHAWWDPGSSSNDWWVPILVMVLQKSASYYLAQFRMILKWAGSCKLQAPSGVDSGSRIV